jgi:Na+/H+ antiporter NhaD/arsenite permease-like protein
VAIYPWRVFALAAGLTLVTSNDVVILALAPAVLATDNPARSAAALFVGANVSAVLLPQASPTNVMVATATGLDFGGYLTLAWPVGVVMVATAAVIVVVGLRPTARVPRVRERLNRTQKLVLTVAAASVLAQPVAERFGLSPAGLGLVLSAFAVLLAVTVRLPVREVLEGGAWLVVPIGGVMVAAGQLLAKLFGSGLGAVIALFATAGVATDLAVAATGAQLAAEGQVPAAGVLAAVTAGAFLTPVGSISGLLLIQQFRSAKVTIPWITVFGTAATIAIVVFAAALMVVSVSS